MPLSLDGATRVHYIVGDPIAQVKSPGGVSACLQERGHNAVVLPAHVSPTDLATWVAGVSLAQNVDEAIEFYRRALSAPDGRASRRAEEQLANMLTRKAKSLAEQGERAVAKGAGHHLCTPVVPIQPRLRNQHTNRNRRLHHELRFRLRR